MSQNATTLEIHDYVRSWTLDNFVMMIFPLQFFTELVEEWIMSMHKDKLKAYVDISWHSKVYDKFIGAQMVEGFSIAKLYNLDHKSGLSNWLSDMFFIFCVHNDYNLQNFK